MKIRSLLLTAAAVLAFTLPGYSDTLPDAGMLRYPDVSHDKIVFVYGGNLWTVSRDGGLASPLASPDGGELFPKFDAEGERISFVGNYDGGTDLYVIPVEGGIATRMTHHPAGELLCDWTSDGKLLFSSNELAGLSRMTQLFTISSDQPLPAKLPVPYGANGAISADGKWLAYTPYSRDMRTWKRYRGGMASDIWLFNLEDHRSQQMTDWEGTDTLPMWHGQTVYYLSDAGPEHRLNIWKYDTNTGARTQITKYADYDVKWPSMGPGADDEGEIVFQQGSDLVLLNLKSNETTVVEVRIPGDRPKLRPQQIDAAEYISGATVSPEGVRVAVEARGDIWTLPAKKGAPRNLTNTDGIAERYPSWSPDKKWIAYFSDATGEYELTITQSDGRGETRRLTSDGAHWRYAPVWSPDSKHIAFTDKTSSLFIHTIESGETKKVDSDPWANRQGYSWSHDSAYIAYSKSADDNAGNSAIWIYTVASGESKQLTSGYFNEANPTFDRKGDFLYFQSNRNFNGPQYEDLGTTFIYRDTTVLLALPLRADVKNPMLPKIDEVTWEDDKEEDSKDEKDEKEEDGDDDDGDEDEGDDDDDQSDADPVSGNWTISIESNLIPANAANTSIQLQLSGTTVTGTIQTPDGALEIQNGSFDPASGTLRFSVMSPAGEAVIEGTVKDNAFSGTVKISNIGLTAPISGQRQVADDDDDDAEEKEEASDDESKDDGKKEETKAEPFTIDFENADMRVLPLPLQAGSFGSMGVNDKNQLIYVRRGQDGPPAIKLFDINADEPKEDTVVAGAGAFDVTADGKKLLVMQGRSAFIIGASAGQSLKDKISTNGMRRSIEPRTEWKQVFTDAWRVQRDFFYDPTMHGVDWDAVRRRYEKLLKDATSRDDVGYIIGEMISELNVGHAYYRGIPDGPSGPSANVGLLGCRFEAVDGSYKIAEIYQGGPWDTDARNPLSMAGVKEGEFILEVDGRPLTADQNAYAAFEGMAGSLVSLTISEDAKLDDEDRRVAIQLIGDDSELRFRDWIEHNRRYVEEKSDGKIGYIYVVNTGVPGQNDLFRQFYAQAGKAALIIDDRWNGGGQIPTRFIELLNRPAVNMWARRDGRDWIWPPDSHQGPKCMLINGLAGSGGDMFPALFRQVGLGKLIGRRTWGGLVGITGGPSMIDGASVTAPSFAYYELDGTWGIEGHGVDPDIEVIDDPALMVEGGDPQLDAAVEHLKQELETKAFQPPARPAYPNRAAMGLPDEDR